MKKTFIISTLLLSCSQLIFATDNTTTIHASHDDIVISSDDRGLSQLTSPQHRQSMPTLLHSQIRDRQINLQPSHTAALRSFAPMQIQRVKADPIATIYTKISATKRKRLTRRGSPLAN